MQQSHEFIQKNLDESNSHENKKDEIKDKIIDLLMQRRDALLKNAKVPGDVPPQFDTLEILISQVGRNNLSDELRVWVTNELEGLLASSYIENTNNLPEGVLEETKVEEMQILRSILEQFDMMEKTRTLN